MEQMIGGFVLAILIGLGLFLILRIFWLWYWKIDKIVELLENINNNTKNPSTKKVTKKIVEHKDATELELKEHEINTGIYIFDADKLFKILPIIDNTNNQKEYYPIQIAIMAPTEILARQHFNSMQDLLFKYGISSHLLV